MKMTVVIKKKTHTHQRAESIIQRNILDGKICYEKYFCCNAHYYPYNTWVPVCEMHSICILPAFKNGITTSFVLFLAHTFLLVFVFPNQCFLSSLLQKLLVDKFNT